MRIEKVEIKNLRCIKDSSATFDPYTCFVGPNGAGKSTVLCALNIFFRNLENAPTDLASLTAEDFFLHDTSNPIEITVTFCDLSPDAVIDLKDYVRQGKLTVSAVARYDPQNGRAEVRQYGQRLGMKEFIPFFEKYGDGAPVSELKGIFEGLENSIPELKAKSFKKTKDGMCEGLKQFEGSKSEQCVLIPSADQFYGISAGKDRLSKYIQWIYIPAVKNVSDEQVGTKTSALGKLLARTVSAQTNFKSELETITSQAITQYQRMLSDNQQTLDGISSSLSSRLAQWSHPDATLRIVWDQDSQAAVKINMPLANVVAGESGFEGKLARLGHGLQRSFLLALLQELATYDDKKAPTLILGCEEPELYQHPPQAKHLASVFEKLASEGAQILVTTHSPYFVSGGNFENVRMVRRKHGEKWATINQYTFAELAKRNAEVSGKKLKADAISVKLHQALQPSLTEMFFTQCLILVEGLEDIAYLQAWFVLTGQWEEFRRLGIHIVPTNGKSELIRPSLIAKGLDIPTLAIIDADGDKLMRLNKETNVMEVNQSVKTNHEHDNKAMIKIFGGDETDLFPIGVVWDGDLVIWPSDFADTVKREAIVALGSQGAEKFEDIENKARGDSGFANDLQKNSVYIGHLLTHFKATGATSPSLDTICKKILNFARPPAAAAANNN